MKYLIIINILITHISNYQVDHSIPEHPYNNGNLNV